MSPDRHGLDHSFLLRKRKFREAGTSSDCRHHQGPLEACLEVMSKDLAKVRSADGEQLALPVGHDGRRVWLLSQQLSVTEALAQCELPPRAPEELTRRGHAAAPAHSELTPLGQENGFRGLALGGHPRAGIVALRPHAGREGVLQLPREPVKELDRIQELPVLSITPLGIFTEHLLEGRPRGAPARDPGEGGHGGGTWALVQQRQAAEGVAFAERVRYVAVHTHRQRALLNDKEGVAHLSLCHDHILCLELKFLHRLQDHVDLFVGEHGAEPVLPQAAPDELSRAGPHCAWLAVCSEVLRHNVKSSLSNQGRPCFRIGRRKLADGLRNAPGANPLANVFLRTLSSPCKLSEQDDRRLASSGLHGFGLAASTAHPLPEEQMTTQAPRAASE
mmetsp:Transcript_102802/g.329713  ORF Transcript_102802/g.329713 Transcript_102802/m.329713 type:complete len:390 (+) Transcript_102802:1956-3125(+)